jgi:hypothetical protein
MSDLQVKKADCVRNASIFPMGAESSIWKMMGKEKSMLKQVSGVQ